jgi:hypothetical protein
MSYWGDYPGSETKEYILNENIPGHIVWGHKGNKATNFLTYGVGNILGNIDILYNLALTSGMNIKGLKPFREDNLIKLSMKYQLIKNIVSQHEVASSILNDLGIVNVYSVSYKHVYKYWALSYILFYNDISIDGVRRSVAELVNQNINDVQVIDYCNPYLQTNLLLFQDLKNYSDEGRISNSIDDLSDDFDKMFANNLNDIFKRYKDHWNVFNFGHNLISTNDVEEWGKQFSNIIKPQFITNAPFIEQLVNSEYYENKTYDIIPSEHINIYFRRDSNYEYNKEILQDYIKYALNSDIFSIKIIGY